MKMPSIAELRNKIGLPAPSVAADAVHRETSVAEARRRIDVLPKKLQQAFDLKLVEEEHGVMFSNTQAELQAATESWFSEVPTVVLLHGQPGGGKTTAINQWLQQLGKRRRLRVSVDQTVRSEAGLCELLASALGEDTGPTANDLSLALQGTGRRIIVMERTHNLFLRSVGGYEALEALLSVIVETPNLLWVLSMDTESWLLLDRLFSLQEVATHVVGLPPLDAAESEAMIMQRLAGTGMAARFLDCERGSELPAESAEGQKDQTELQAAWFKAVHEITRGHPAASLFHWLDALDWRDAEQQLWVYRPAKLSLKLVVGLQPSAQEMDRLLVLAGIMNQGEAALLELASTLGWDPRRAATSTHWLQRRSIVILRVGNMLRVNPVFVGQVTTELRRQHLVY